jgi:hypothetical protein
MRSVPLKGLKARFQIPSNSSFFSCGIEQPNNNMKTGIKTLRRILINTPQTFYYPGVGTTDFTDFTDFIL